MADVLFEVAESTSDERKIVKFIKVRTYIKTGMNVLKWSPGEVNR